MNIQNKITKKLDNAKKNLVKRKDSDSKFYNNVTVWENGNHKCMITKIILNGNFIILN